MSIYEQIKNNLLNVFVNQSPSTEEISNCSDIYKAINNKNMNSDKALELAMLCKNYQVLTELLQSHDNYNNSTIRLANKYVVDNFYKLDKSQLLDIVISLDKLNKNLDGSFSLFKELINNGEIYIASKVNMSNINHVDLEKLLLKTSLSSSIFSKNAYNFLVDNGVRNDVKIDSNYTAADYFNLSKNKYKTTVEIESFFEKCQNNILNSLKYITCDENSGNVNSKVENLSMFMKASVISFPTHFYKMGFNYLKDISPKYLHSTISPMFAVGITYLKLQTINNIEPFLKNFCKNKKENIILYNFEDVKKIVESNNDLYISNDQCSLDIMKAHFIHENNILYLCEVGSSCMFDYYE